MRTRRFLAILGTSFVAAAWPSARVFAQRQGDEGEYVILQARYGTRGRNIDVTERLRQLARRDRPIRVTNELFGNDPAFGEQKTLRIYARGPDGGTRIFEYREHDYVDTTQFRGWRGGRWGQAGGWRGGWEGDEPGRRGRDGGGPRRGFFIESAVYGDGRRGRDVTERVRSLVRGGRLDIPVENSTFGFDPSPGREKELVLVYSLDGVRQEVRVPERQRLSLP